METIPKWKRARDDITSQDNPPAKKPKTTVETSASLLAQLQTGLQYIESAHDISADAKRYAQELSRILFGASACSKHPPRRGSNGSLTSKTDHTAVPPPFYAPKIPAYDGSEPLKANSSSAKTLPPLPPITDLTLLTAPFTHTSTLPTYMPPTNTNTYEPLEFLGDAYLEVIATRIIHDRFPNHTVGQKSGLREILIRNDTLFQYSRDYGFGQRVKVVGAEPNGKIWLKVLADVFEAYVACVILSDPDRGFQTAETWLAQLWEPRINEWRTQGDGKDTAVEQFVNLDVKSDLQRLLVSKGVKLDYLEEKPMELMREGNRTTFFMGVYLTGWGYSKQKLGSGSGRSKQIASAEAAKDAFVTGRKIVEEAHRSKVAYDKVHSAKRLK